MSIGIPTTIVLDYLRSVCCVVDLFTGYNTDGFDFPYLFARAEALGIADQFLQLGRVPGVKATIKDQVFSSRAFGTHDVKDIKIHGRIRMDIFPLIRRDYKLGSYTLNNVSHHFLEMRKSDVPHSIITTLQNGSSRDRARLAEYCHQDVILPLELLRKLSLIENKFELSRVTGIPVEDIFTRGQIIRQFSLLLRYARKYEFLLPTEPKSSMPQDYKGATVLTPKRGFYRDPIIILDFKVSVVVRVAFSRLYIPFNSIIEPR